TAGTPNGLGGPLYVAPNRLRSVGADLPSVTNTPGPAASVATKYPFPPAATKLVGFDGSVVGLSRATSLVPAAVPSVAHSCRPVVPSSAWNSSRPPTAARPTGPALAPADHGAGFGVANSRTIAVPAAVPSVAHSCRPWAASPMVKRTRPPTTSTTA